MSQSIPNRFQQVRRVLRQTIQRYTPTLQTSPQADIDLRQKAAVKENLTHLAALEARLANPVLRVAVFGLVSRGKSAVINALVGEPILPTGPLHGVTRWPRSVYWKPPIEAIHDVDELPQLELIDTPGLDEVDGEARGAMAQEVAQQADLILFVVAGDITRTEYQALVALQEMRKPLLLVFNKTDLYPEADRHAIVEALTELWESAARGMPNVALAITDIVKVAAEPAPLQVRVEWPDGHLTHEWEALPPDIHDLKQALLLIARQDGSALITLNALREADALETEMAKRAVMLHAEEAEALIWQFAKYKAIAIALNPIGVLDVLGGVVTDLAMIRALAKLYGLPITQHEARRLWQAISKSAGAVVMSELGTGLLLGAGKGVAAVWSVFDSASGLTALLSVMAAQAGAAGYGTYAVGKAAQIYLEQGCTWGPNGVKAVMQDLLSQIDSDSTVDRLKAEIEAQMMGQGARP